MDFPTNAAYGPMDAPKEEPRAVEIAGVRVPGQHVWMLGVGILGLVAVATIIILFALPSGIPFLAAKFAGGFLEYVGLFFVYMVGFLFLLMVLGALLALAGAQAIPFLTRNNG
jgi:hypothetical protein